MPDPPSPADAPCARAFPPFAQAMIDAVERQVAILGEDGNIVAVNRAWREHVASRSGAIRDAVAGSNFFVLAQRFSSSSDGVSPQMVRMVRDVAMRQSPRCEFDYSYSEGGQTTWITMRVTRFAFEGRGFLVLTKEDITARQRAQQMLRDSEQRFRQWAETSSDMICRHAPDGTMVYVSPASRTILGYDPDELIGRMPYDYFHPDDVDRIRQSHDRVLGPGPTEAIAYRFRRADGQYQWVESTSLGLTDDSGAVVEIHTATRDIQQRRQQEEALRRIQTAIDQVQDSVVITDPELESPGPRIVYVNPAFTRLSGYRAAEVIGKTPRILQGPRTDRAVLDRLRSALTAGKVFHGSTVNYRKDGSEFLVEWQVAPVRDEQGRLINYVSIQRDITQKAREQERARKREAELAHVARLSTMGEMASGLAHELNQPLSAVVNYTQGCLRRMQRGDWTPGPLIGAMTQATDQATRAAEIIRRLRQFIHKRGPKVAPTRLDELINDAAGLIEHDLRREQIKLIVEPSPALPPVNVDAIQIEQVVLNLMRNAADAMKANGDRPKMLTVRTSMPDRATVRIELIDTGPAVQPATLAHLFEPFFTTKPDGMGLGLSISQSIVQTHGGRITAAGNSSGGMTFTINLPVHVNADAAAGL